MYWDELRDHAGLRGGVLVYTGAHRAAPAGAAGAVAVPVPEQKAKPRGAGTTRPTQDKPRAGGRAQRRLSKTAAPKTPKTPGPTPSEPGPSPEAESVPREPLDVGPILDELLERVWTQCALAAADRQVRDPPLLPQHPPKIWGGFGGLGGFAGAVSALCPQRVPFTVARARDAILFVAEWRFLVRDDGDPESEGDGVWEEDEEPQSCLLDSWTPGIVAVAEPSLFWEEVRRSPNPPEPARAVALTVSPTPGPLCPWPGLVRGSPGGNRG